ncbi:MAG: response regulator [Lachnospiraceae bacterium]|nr:response regulator [Lachnospiraceae bacterium]
MGKIEADHKKTEHSCKSVRIIKGLFFAVFFLSLFGLCFFSAMDREGPLEYPDPVFIEEWTVTSPEGNVFTAGSSYRNEAMERGAFTMEADLPGEITSDAYLCFIIGGDVSVFIDGELRQDFVAARDIPLPGGCVKRFYMRIPLTSADSGARAKIVRSGTGRGGYVYQNTFVAGNGSFFRFMMHRYGLSFLLEAILLIFSVVIVIISLILTIQYKKQIKMLYGAMSILVISCWLITNSFLYPFVFGHYHLDGIMNYLCCLLMPFSLVFYLNALQNGRYQKIMISVLWVAVVNLVVWPMLHFTGILPFPRALIYIDAFLGAEVFVVAGVLVKDLIQGRIREYRYTALGYAGFLVCGLWEIAVLTILPKLNSDVMMLAGLAFMLVLAVIQQMSDLKQEREEGRRAVDLSEAKTRFLASMSHEIRTPINAILGMNEMIIRETKDPVISDYALSVKTSGQMLLMLVNDVLDFSKIEAGKMQINKAEFKLSSLLRNVMPMLKERSDEKGLKLQTVILNEVPDGQVSDEFRIRQILINLTNNAIKYTDAGSVTISFGGRYTGEDAYMLMMSVRDTGRGIHEEDQKHLFEAFTRADERKNRNIEGTGLGLAIVKSIVDSMEGEIAVQSRYGEGSEFTVRLPVGVTDRRPLAEDYDRQGGAEASAGESNYCAPEASILAVDDNSSNLRIVKLFLKRLRIEPELCDSGMRAIELSRSKHYDLILLDHMMPDPDGIKTLQLIRSDEASQNKDTPAIVLTANALAGSDKVYFEAGFADYLTKPLDSAVLEQAIKKYLPEEKILAPDAVKEPDAQDLSMKERLKRIEGLDYAAALRYTGNNEELLFEIIGIIVEEDERRLADMRKNMDAEDWEAYCRDAHTIKSHLASIGLAKLSGRAKRHEMAAKQLDLEFIRSDCDAFIREYGEICRRLKD